MSRCAGKDVLHLGFLAETDRPIAERLELLLTARSLHSRLSRVARVLVGVDLDEVAIHYLREQGLADVYQGNVESLDESDVPTTPLYTVVLAGDVIEHLSNPGRMLDCIEGFLDPAGDMILTTPNTFGLANYFRFIRGTFRDSTDHVQSYSLFTLSHLLRRHGWQVKEAYTSYQERAPRTVGALAFRFGRWVFERSPRFGGTLLVLCGLMPADGESSPGS